MITRPLDGVEAELGLGKGALGRTNDRSIPKGKMEVWGGDGHDSGVGREQEGAQTRGVENDREPKESIGPAPLRDEAPRLE